MDREGIRVDETNRRYPQNQAPRAGEGRLAILDDSRGLPSVAAPENPNGRSVAQSPEKRRFSTRPSRAGRPDHLDFGTLYSKVGRRQLNYTRLEPYFNKLLKDEE